LAGSVEVTEDEVAVDPELGKGTKVKGRGDGVDCGGAPVNGVASFGNSPSNEVVVLCGAEELAVDALAMLGSNNGFGAIGGFLSVASPAATSENDKLVVADGFSCTVDFPNRLEVPLVLVVAVAVDAGRSSVALPNENRDGAGFPSDVFPNAKVATGLLSSDAVAGIAEPFSSLCLLNVKCAGTKD
jgi:hypothetical protein